MILVSNLGRVGIKITIFTILNIKNREIKFKNLDLKSCLRPFN